jgi:hypothetical protein
MAVAKAPEIAGPPEQCDGVGGGEEEDKDPAQNGNCLLMTWRI